jgi:hypothetical protein
MSDDFWDHIQNGRQAQPLNNISLTLASHRACAICGKTAFATDSYVIVRGDRIYCGRCWQNALRTHTERLTIPLRTNPLEETHNEKNTNQQRVRQC